VKPSVPFFQAGHIPCAFSRHVCKYAATIGSPQLCGQ
jgi:hypothetical protein